MSVRELKNYLQVRGLKVIGKKEELVARVFVAVENNVQPVKTAVEVEEDLALCYRNKLNVDGKNIPDPMKIMHGWMDEDEGIIFWPMLTFPDIFTYLMFFPTELGSTDLSDYKLCKAYSYYKNGWLEPLKYHNLSGSKFCIIKGQCRPSLSINNPFHQLWILLEKTGKIRTCYCSCMAGMSQTCNHVAAALYRVEAAVRSGLTNPSCTSKPNEWLPGSKAVVDIPAKIKDLKFEREDFGTRGKKKRPLSTKFKQDYDPLCVCSKQPLQLTEIAVALENIAPDSIIHTAIAKPEVDFFVEESTQCRGKNIEAVCIDDIIILSSSKKEFYENLYKNMSKENSIKIEKLTRGQSSNQCWFTFRKAVITGSKGHEIMTKVKKIQKPTGCYIDMYSINEKVSGRTFVNPNVPQLKYGRDMEPEAINAFEVYFSEKHKNVNIEHCGLFLDDVTPFIGASPDGIVSCLCCGYSCLEIKCPFSINFTTPTNPNVKLEYLIKEESGIKLNRRHKYYTQVQMQMGQLFKFDVPCMSCKFVTLSSFWSLPILNIRKKRFQE